METLRFLMVSTFYPPYHLGGDAVHVQYLAEALAERGHEVHVEFSPAAHRVKRRGGPGVAATAADGVHLHPVTRPSQAMSPLAAYLFGDSGVVRRAHERLVRDVKPDVVHLHNISLLGLGVQAAPRGRPLLYTAHDYWFRCPRSDLLKNGKVPCEAPRCFACMVRSRRIPPLWRGAEVANRLDRVDLVIAPSQFLAELARPGFRCPVVHLPNFTPDENPHGRIYDPSAFVLFVGVLEPHKGVKQIAEAARRATTAKRFVLVGRGSLERSLRELAAQEPARLEVGSGIGRTELASLMRRAEAFLMPSVWYENSPLAAIEALSWGCPILGTSRGGVPELVHGGTAGLTFKPSAEGILQALASLDAREDPSTLRRGARAAYEAYHRPGPYVNQYLSLIDSLNHGRGASPLDPVPSTPGWDPERRSEALMPDGHHHP